MCCSATSPSSAACVPTLADAACGCDACIQSRVGGGRGEQQEHAFPKGMKSVTARVIAYTERRHPVSWGGFWRRADTKQRKRERYRAAVGEINNVHLSKPCSCGRVMRQTQDSSGGGTKSRLDPSTLYPESSPSCWRTLRVYDMPVDHWFRFVYD